MSATHPKLVLRIGSHAEKDYFEKLAKGLDGMLIGANLLEITPAASCSLIFSLQAKRNGPALPFYLDPMTYCFAPYVDSMTGLRRTDLDALKSERRESRESKRLIRAVKESYVSLADELGEPFTAAVGDGQACKAIEPATTSSGIRDKVCAAVVSYQLNRLSAILKDDPFMASQFAGTAPAVVFAPYFFTHEGWAVEGLATTLDFASRTAALRPAAPVHAVVCASHSLLTCPQFIDGLLQGLPKTGIGGVWLWFGGFEKFRASTDSLRAFRRLVSGLAASMEVYNLHGGYYSLLLHHDGMTGISHGVGYGEQKAVQQVIGAAAPTVRYYLPALKKRIGIPDLQRALPEVGVRTANDFFAKVCDCTICKGVIANDVSRLRAFGEMHRANGDSKRDSQTPTAAKLSRFHFLMNRIRERSAVTHIAKKDRSKHLTAMAAAWRNCPSIRAAVDEDADGECHIERWAAALE